MKIIRFIDYIKENILELGITPDYLKVSKTNLTISM